MYFYDEKSFAKKKKNKLEYIILSSYRAVIIETRESCKPEVATLGADTAWPHLAPIVSLSDR